ncbi:MULTISPECIES: BREX-2 system adenine-specific DNA-methyltransferase PglX [Streptomyces]|uniref:site-specific DNA-methyltransferase (adenine-specific) n=1 Tax=Streptomyces odorifer TaxID=53450 RepID=A0A7Y6C848_9ACTN|nr:BREX-2 system adenine-specific DNA-methyltransferase PglX [Streptomyces odorifer]NUV28804.1 BREX-2 system adenine-specific DNA-methyltransferase PglX [Streptomyces odorifer]NUV35278.1 BREX-2 system adenine-specific DNA-methyltransferase PglX [Streptomyces sp. KAI-27]NUV48701.1 BREX-2 system adenine-specific DNA-methyltransferase PglX [Streptomyces sp. CAI-78]
MIDRKSLLSDLQKQVKAAETDLDAQVKAVPEVGARLRGEYDQAKKLGRTAATWNSWLGERVTQVAVAWVLGTVFVRFSEDNRLIAEPYITAPDVAGREVAQARYEEYMAKDADPTYRGWLETAFAELGAGQAGRLLFDRDHNPLYQIPLSHDGAGALLAFWRQQKSVAAEAEDGSGSTSVLVHDFTDPLSEDGTEGWDTRFMGDLYQDLSEAARKTYALLQTPEFVEEFILDRTMTPAVREFGFEELKMIDPTCGSGHFVLGAFRRLVRMWGEERPEVGSYERVRAALESVHGVDLNPFAVAVARFRLLVAAMAASGLRTFGAARGYEWPIQLAVGDSLIKDRQLELQLGIGEEGAAGDPLAEFSYATEDVHEYPGILQQGRYHVVVGNPPYITVKDKKLNELYRGLYYACAGTYALSVPFAQRFFELAKQGEGNEHGYGMVGQITANSFMKREFGTKLIESFFRDRVELTEVIDSSGAYIPGHGTPTAILVGRPRDGSKRQATVRTVRSVQGEPSAPKDAKEGLVWRAIVEQIDQPGSVGRWVSVDDLERGRYFGTQPWVLTDGGKELTETLSKGTHPLIQAISPGIGRAVRVGADSAYLRPIRRTYQQTKTNRNALRPFLTGDVVRDWNAGANEAIWFPYAKSIDVQEFQDELWPYRALLRERRTFQGDMASAGLNWWDYMQFTSSAYTSPLSIMFAFVATHNHFVLDRGGSVFNRHAPVIKLRDGAAEEEYLQLLGMLNSSTAGFWLKMVSHSKGTEGHQSGIKTELWEQFYEFTGTKLQEFPLPAQYPIALATELDTLAQRLSATTPSALASEASPTAPALRDAETRYTSTRAHMIALQEELDWQVYSLYNLHSEDLRLPDSSAVPDLALGERAFEIALARRVKAGEASDEWFKRHGTTPITEIPSHWPDDYRALVQKRIDVIESNRAIGMIERPEYKRRWATEGWDSMRQKALKSWLLDRIEDRSYWFDANGNPTITTLARLTETLSADEDFTSVADLYAPRQDLAKTVRDLLSEEHVPFVSALRYKPAALKKRADWEHVWDLQREEDAAPDEPAKRKIRERTPVPPKYTSADFLKPSYWRARGKLDVPKERFVSYGTVNAQSPELYGWAGWDHLEQALALASYIQTAGLGNEEIVPFLAGLLELQPWLDQWYGEYDAEFGASPAAEILAFRQQKQGELGLSDDTLRAWRPAPATRARKAAAPKKKAAASAESD